MNPSKQSSIIFGVVVAALLGAISSLIATQLVGSTFASLIPCLIAIIPAFIAVWHYTNTHQISISAGEGASLGAMVMVIGSILSGLLNLGLQAIGLTPTQAEIKALAEATVEKQWKDQGLSPEQIQQSKEMMSSMDWIYNPLLGIISGIVIGLVIGAICGAIAATIFKKGNESPSL